MLVLSRRSDEKIVFPTLGMELSILRVQGNVVSVGIDAPPDIHILRGEIAADARSTVARTRLSPALLSHAMRNRLNKITLRLHLLQRQLQVGNEAEADRTLAEVIEVLGGLDHEATPSETIARPPLKGLAPKFRVLVVEDDANERELLAGLLTMNGCECTTAADGLAALECLSAGSRPDFVLLDMRMPRCDGPQTLRRIRNSSRFDKLRVFAISGTSRRDLSIESGAQGVDAWFAKPLNPRSLWDAMEQHRGQVAAAN